jgi:hypothetical protein
MRLFVVILALAVATRAIAFEHHKGHARMSAKADPSEGCGGGFYRGSSGACVHTPTGGPYKPDPYWMPCDYSSVLYPEGCGD